MKNEILSYDFKEGLSQEFEIINVSQLLKESAEELTQPHRTEFYQIIWFLSEAPPFMVDFNSIKISPNSILFINKNSVLQFPNTKNLKAKSILFTDSFFSKSDTDRKFLRSTLLFNSLTTISQIQIEQSNILFSNIFNQIEIEYTTDKDCYHSDILRNNLNNLLLHSERELKKQNLTTLIKDVNLDYALLFKDLLDIHYKTNKKVSFYSDHMYISPKRLNKATHKVFGKTPKEVINDRILLEAKRLLVHTNDSIKEIGYVLGFEEATNFIKYFKKITKKTPVEFRAFFLAD